VIAFINQRPAIQIGPYQVLDYDTEWLEDAIMRAAKAADHENFNLAPEIRQGVEMYLESKCSLRLLQLDELFERVRKMLVKIGCAPIADKLQPLAPPVTVSLVNTATSAGNGFELAFFETLRSELAELRNAGAEKVHFTGLRESAQILRGGQKWSKHCDNLLEEIRIFLTACDREAEDFSRSLSLSIE
jgi:hypothetical protein